MLQLNTVILTDMKKELKELEPDISNIIYRGLAKFVPDHKINLVDDVATDLVEYISEMLVKNNGVLVDVNERNIAKYDYVWYNERLCKVTDMREWSKKDKGIRVEVLDLDSRKGYTVAISSLRYVR